MRMRRFAAAACAAALATALLLTGCSTAGAPGSGDAGIVRVNGTEPANPLIPADTVDAGGERIIDAIFSGLLYYDATGAPVNELAQSIEASEKNTVFTITIASGTKFTDGTEVTSASFVKAWEWAALKSNKALKRASFADILGYSDDEDVSLVDSGGLVIVDGRTFQVHLTSSLPDFPQRLGLPEFLPLPSAFFDDPAAFGETPIGNGPYMFDGEGAWKHGKRLELTVNPAYKGVRVPTNTGLTMLFYDSLDLAYVDLLAGDLDVLDRLPASARPTFKDELGRRWLDQPLTGLDTITIPTRLDHLSKEAGVLRRAAISMSIDRDTIIATLFGITRAPAHDFATPALSTYSDNVRGTERLDFNPDEAKQRWADAEVIKPWDEATLEIAYDSESGDQAWAEAVARSISSVLPLKVTAVPYPTRDALDAVIADRSIASAYTTPVDARYPGVYAFIGSLYPSKSPANGAGYVSKDFDTFMKQAALATTAADTAVAYQRAQGQLLTDLPAIPLWNTTVQAGYGEKVSGVALDWQGIPLYYLIAKAAG
jgi:oligopeptide transport system substrate-binding protein